MNAVKDAMIWPVCGRANHWSRKQTDHLPPGRFQAAALEAATLRIDAPRQLLLLHAIKALHAWDMPLATRPFSTRQVALSISASRAPKYDKLDL